MEASEETRPTGRVVPVSPRPVSAQLVGLQAEEDDGGGAAAEDEAVLVVVGQVLEQLGEGLQPAVAGIYVSDATEAHGHRLGGAAALQGHEPVVWGHRSA